MIKSYVTHTAILVKSIDKVAVFFQDRGFHINKAESFSHEGTREIYIGDLNKNSSNILLVEPEGEGPYKTALEKRGQGLHHIGVDVENLIEYCTVLGRQGWLLHTHSLKSIPQHKTAYLARPGVPFLLEVRERLNSNNLPPLLLSVSLPNISIHQKLIDSIHSQNLHFKESTKNEIFLETIAGSCLMSEVIKSERKMK